MASYSCFSMGSGDSPASGAEAVAFRAGPDSSEVVAWEVFEVRPDVGEARTGSARVIASAAAGATQLSAPSRNCPYGAGLAGWFAWLEGDRVVAVDTTRAVRLTSATPRPPGAIVRSPLLDRESAFDILLLSADGTELMLVAVDTSFELRPAIGVPWSLVLPGAVSESAARFGNGPGSATRHVALLADGDRVLHTCYPAGNAPAAPDEVRLPEGQEFLNGPISLCVGPDGAAIVTCVQTGREESPMCRLASIRFPAEGGPAAMGQPTEVGTLPSRPIWRRLESTLASGGLRHEMIAKLTSGPVLSWSGGILTAADDAGTLTDPPLLFPGEQFLYVAELRGESLAFL